MPDNNSINKRVDSHLRRDKYDGDGEHKRSTLDPSRRVERAGRSNQDTSPDSLRFDRFNKKQRRGEERKSSEEKRKAQRKEAKKERLRIAREFVDCYHGKEIKEHKMVLLLVNKLIEKKLNEDKMPILMSKLVEMRRILNG